MSKLVEFYYITSLLRPLLMPGTLSKINRLNCFLYSKSTRVDAVEILFDQSISQFFQFFGFFINPLVKKESTFI